MDDDRIEVLEKIREQEQYFKDTIENDPKDANYYDKVKDIKYVDSPTWTENRGGAFNSVKDDLFLVEVERHHKTPDGTSKVEIIPTYFIGKECIGGNIKNNLFYTENFEAQKQQNSNKAQTLSRLVEDIESGKIDIDKYSYNDLQNERYHELAKTFSVYLGEEVDAKTAKKALEEINDTQKVKMENELGHKDPSDISEEQTKKLGQIHGIEELDLSKKADGKNSIGDLLLGQGHGYSKIMVVYSEKANDLTGQHEKVNNTRYTLIGIPDDSKKPAIILNDEFEVDPYSGVNSNDQKTNIRYDGRVERNNNVTSSFVSKETGKSLYIMQDNNNELNFFYSGGRTLEENESVGMQLQTRRTGPVSQGVRSVVNKNKGYRNYDRVQDEAYEHILEGCTPTNPKDYDGDRNTSTHDHSNEKKSRNDTEPQQANGIQFIEGTSITPERLARKLGYSGPNGPENALKALETAKKENPGKDNNQLIDELEEQANEKGHTLRTR